ncbi:MAG: hypothetical protein IPJ79_13450 [Bacteroidetes bacterium]|nr:hypothetical protein [Bacteroidota bacterium]
MRTRKTPYNRSYKKLAVQWLNEALYFVSSSLLADSFALRKRQLLVAANRQDVKKLKNYSYELRKRILSR